MFFFVKIAFALLSFKRKAVQFCWSPSTRREWIEIGISHSKPEEGYLVSLHTEGVD